MQKRTVIILLTIALAFIAIVVTMIILSITTNKDSSQVYLEDAVTITIDEDTGESAILDDPNLSNQEVENKGVVVFGLEELASRGVLRVQLIFIKDKIAEYANLKLGGVFESVTIRPQDLKEKDGVYTSSLRLGQTDELVPITITADFSGKTRVVITDPQNKHGGTYDSGIKVFTAD